MKAIARFVQRRARTVLVLAGLLAVLGAALSLVVQPRLSSSLSDYDDPGSEVVAAQRELQKAAGYDPEQGYVVLVRSPEKIRPGGPPPAVLERTVRLLDDRPEVKRVVAPLNSGNPAMISRDGRSAYVLASVGEVKEKDAVAELREAVGSDPVLKDRVVLGGSTVGNVETSEISTEDLARAEMFAVPLLLFGLLLVFRGLVAAAMPLLGALFAILLTLTGLALTQLVLDVSIFAMNLVTALGMGLAVDFSLLVVSRFREELAREQGESGQSASDGAVSAQDGKPDAGKGAPAAPDRATVRRALEATLSTAGRTVLFSAVTVAASLACLSVFPQRFLYSMGLAGAMTALAAACFALLVLPALLFLLGPRINALAPARLRRAPTPPGSGRWYRIAQRVLRRPVLWAVGAAVVLLTAGAPFSQAKLGGFDAGVLPDSSTSHTVASALERDFDDASASPVTVTVRAPDVTQAELARYRAALEDVDGVDAAGPPVDSGRGLWIVDVRLTADEPLSDQARSVVQEIREVPAPGSSAVLGETARFESLVDSLVARLPYVVLTMFGLSALVLFVMTGSLVLAVKNIVMNTLTIAASFGVLVVVFQWGWLGFGEKGVLEVTSLVIAGVLVSALSTDYGVFLLDRIKEERDKGRDDRAAVAVGLDATGPVVSAAAVLLFIPLVAMTTSRVQPLQQLGLGAALAVLIDATLVRGALVPSLMALLGRWNWASPGPLRAVHRRVTRALGIETVSPGGPAGHAAGEREETGVERGNRAGNDEEDGRAEGADHEDEEPTWASGAR